MIFFSSCNFAAALRFVNTLYFIAGDRRSMYVDRRMYIEDKGKDEKVKIVVKGLWHDFYQKIKPSKETNRYNVPITPARYSNRSRSLRV